MYCFQRFILAPYLHYHLYVTRSVVRKYKFRNIKDEKRMAFNLKNDEVTIVQNVDRLARYNNVCDLGRKTPFYLNVSKFIFK
jgi:hypothetical protein